MVAHHLDDEGQWAGVERHVVRQGQVNRILAGELGQDAIRQPGATLHESVGLAKARVDGQVEDVVRRDELRDGTPGGLMPVIALMPLVEWVKERRSPELRILDSP